MKAAVIEARGIAKQFGAVKALSDIDLTVNEGEVVAIVGDNGAGKSTFIKILAGAHPPSSGRLFLDGEEVAFKSPQDAAAKGVATTYQELALAENLSVYENVFLGREMTARFLGFIPILRRGAMRDRVDHLIRRLDAHIPDPGVPVSTLSGGQRQATAIARALELDARLVIMDEPTAALAVAESRKVLALIRRLRDQGKAVVLISHNIADVFEVSDRIAIFRRGRKVAERETGNTNPEEIVAFITGAHASVRGQETAAAQI
ncbi:MAG TPA: ATP-binding cassette domain-containing protein [Roseiarcus sp.]|nr:ATP-binding cassette domain-containing protein [Roseiarcus sp.]